MGIMICPGNLYISSCFFLVITCSPVEEIPNGRFQNTPDFKFGSVLSIDCDEGYFMYGKSKIECIDEDQNGIGEWNSKLPSCFCE